MMGSERVIRLTALTSIRSGEIRSLDFLWEPSPPVMAKLAQSIEQGWICYYN